MFQCGSISSSRSSITKLSYNKNLVSSRLSLSFYSIYLFSDLLFFLCACVCQVSELPCIHLSEYVCSFFYPLCTYVSMCLFSQCVPTFLCLSCLCHLYLFNLLSLNNLYLTAFVYLNIYSLNVLPSISLINFLL